MKLSGLISVRGYGRYIDINSFEIDTIKYVINNYLQFQTFDNENNYVDYMGEIDENIINTKEEINQDIETIKKNTLIKYANTYSKDLICNELKIVCSKKASTEDAFKYIEAPTRFEFLTSIALIQHFKNIDVCPNYGINDEGLPKSTAKGNMADIICYDKDYNSYFEVTLMCGRNDQVNNEILPISRHLQEAIKKSKNKSFSILIAPRIHQDTIEAAEWQNIKYKINIITLDINEFVKQVNICNKPSDLLFNSVA